MVRKESSTNGRTVGLLPQTNS